MYNMHVSNNKKCEKTHSKLLIAINSGEGSKWQKEKGFAHYVQNNCLTFLIK